MMRAILLAALLLLALAAAAIPAAAVKTCPLITDDTQVCVSTNDPFINLSAPVCYEVQNDMLVPVNEADCPRIL